MTEPARRGFVPVRDLPTPLWLLAALATAPAAALAHPIVPAPRWLVIHLLLLGAVTHSILVWSRHFADAVLHTAPRPGDHRRTPIRLALLNGGVLAVVGGVLAALWPLTLVGALAVAAAVVWHGGVLLGQLRRALPARSRRCRARPPASMLRTRIAPGAERSAKRALPVLSVLAALLWLAGTLVALLAGLLAEQATAAATWVAAGQRLARPSP